MKKRVLSLLLAVVMVWSLLPTAVLAAGGELAGDGRADSPYQIAGAADLMAFAEMVNGGKSGICAELTANIDLTGEDWVPIGVKGASYSGTFDGKYLRSRWTSRRTAAMNMSTSVCSAIWRMPLSGTSKPTAASG